MSKFQIILIAVFVLCIVAGVAAFATFKSDNSDSNLPPITVWGTFPSDTFQSFVSEINKNLAKRITIDYREISEANFRKTFIEELARGKGPDAILIPQDLIMGYEDKIVEVPNTVLTRRDYQNTFIGQADLYLTPTGSLALPLIVDPLVMYWNKTMFTNAGIAKYPVYWDEFEEIGKRLTLKDENSNIRRSALALGEFKNISHAREILSTLFFQAGNPVTYFSNEGSLVSSLGDRGVVSGTQSSSPALTFFTKFSNPRDPQYSWNRSLPTSKNSFLAGNLATYFGFTSEISEIREKNPNIDYDVAPIPQIRTGKVRTTYGNMYGISIARSTTNQSNTYMVMQILTSPESMAVLSELTYLPSVRRDVIATGSVDPYMAIFLDAALISKGWLDTDPTVSNQIFTELVESVTSGREDTYRALRQASDELDLSLKNI